MPDNARWLAYLDHFSATLDIFLRTGQIQCACLFYVLSIASWHNFSQWWRLSKAERADERAKFVAYVARIRPHSPWTRDYAPYPVELAALQQMEAAYLKYGHGYSCARMAVLGLLGKMTKLFLKLRALV